MLVGFSEDSVGGYCLFPVKEGEAENIIRYYHVGMTGPGNASAGTADLPTELVEDFFEAEKRWNEARRKVGKAINRKYPPKRRLIFRKPLSKEEMEEIIGLSKDFTTTTPVVEE